MLSERIQALLSINRRTATDLALYCGVTPQAAHGWLTGAEPRAHRKEVIAAFFGISRQALEYAPLLSLNHFHNKVDGSYVTPEVSEQAADMMIAKALDGNPPRSVEYRQGMRDMAIQILSGKTLKLPFQMGSCQADAYLAGGAHAEELFSELQQLE